MDETAIFPRGSFSRWQSQFQLVRVQSASNDDSVGVSSQVIVRNNPARSTHRLICHVSRRRLKNICPNPNWFFSDDCAGSIHGRTWRNQRCATRLASGNKPNNVSCCPAA